MSRSPVALGILLALVMSLPAAAAGGALPMLVRVGPDLILPQDATRLDDRWMLLEVPAAGSPEDTAAALAARLGTEVVHDVVMGLAADTRFGEKWPLANTGQAGGSPERLHRGTGDSPSPNPE